MTGSEQDDKKKGPPKAAPPRASLLPGLELRGGLAAAFGERAADRTVDPGDPLSAAGAAARIFRGADEELFAARIRGMNLVQEASSVFTESYLADLEAQRQATEEFVALISDDLGMGAVNALQMIGKAAAGGFGDFDDAIKAVGGSIAGSLGDILINAGTTVLLTATGFKELRDSLGALLPEKGIAAGMLMVAAGAAMKSATSSFLSGGGSGSGGGGGSVGSLTSSVRGSRREGVVEVTIEGGDVINLRDFKQRESLKRALRELAGTREIVLK